MKRCGFAAGRTVWILLALVLGGAAGVSAKGQNDRRQQYGYPGMHGGMMGGGMMGGGMMGATPWWEGYGSPGVPLQRTVDIPTAESLVNDYLKRFGAKNLKIAEIMEFEYNLYVLIGESDSGKKAFELLVDPFTGAVSPEPGPNMMWNTKYGMMSPAGAVGNALTAEAAEKIATEYLLRVRGGGPYKVDASEFYGYYTLDYELDGRVLGMLSVNAFTGQVWYHSWHGGFLGEEEMGKMSM